ncbi:MAG: bifunctional 3-(3-hydroxy-phenyl)propionate/3-hydroxycinnamic acid hydroxylase [Sphingobium sp.]|nr:bifunctional 3-(3-hydroxy-phenyl)propionate/3-hydroxycinnamic acid hydroxylase [Sphingobium sp.]MBP8671777.1 bifunctional 3-(3-hydroxy-phenyl)propionate/3-hydroxycinnamic acid hydroxylase [Sphingobium sp.]MBP9158037.1 bifunctional 3-(3-hydroxy-phenyl)propionate/3-hydroxycinnamic acid hydroxylase [Sphingobium sp.]MCC6480917.1 bifunctional 3-(3-hydroxy-phenyl)propionate/3-hydroxycinnamic acid hydroxylase [Sphingomonadaceae bacterium]
MTGGKQLTAEVVIVGAGPAGLLLANYMGLYGVSTILIEKNPSTVSEPRAVSIDDESLRAVGEAGLYETVSGNLMPGYGSRYQSRSGSAFARVMPTTREYGFPRRNAFHQDVYEAQLREKAQSYKCVKLLFEHHMDSFVQDEDGVTISVTAPTGKSMEVRAQYLSACDGASSPVRTTLDIPLIGSTYAQQWLIIDILDSKDPYRHTRVFCDPTRPGISLPGPRRSRRFEFMLVPGEDPVAVLDDANIRALLRAHGPDEHAEVRRKCVYTFHARIAERWKVGRILLHGDAAHLTPPFAGQGMNSGVRDIANSAWKLAAVIKGRLGAEILETYEEERKGHAWQLIQMAMLMGKVMMPASPLRAALTQAAFRLIRFIPPLSDYITQMKYKPKPRFETGFFIRRGNEAGDVVGRMFPNAVVADPDHHEMRLDKVLGDGFVLLVCSDRPGTYYNALPHDLLGANELKVLCVTREETNFPNDERHAFVRDAADEAYGHLRQAGLEECAVLLRPDRYVMAVIEAGMVARDYDRVRAMINATWGKGQRPITNSAKDKMKESVPA